MAKGDAPAWEGIVDVLQLALAQPIERKQVGAKEAVGELLLAQHVGGDQAHPLVDETLQVLREHPQIGDRLTGEVGHHAQQRIALP